MPLDEVLPGHRQGLDGGHPVARLRGLGRPGGRLHAPVRAGSAGPQAGGRALLLARARAQPAGDRRLRSAPVLMSKHILGISCFYHDSAAALLKDGVVVAACQEERLSRKKHDSDFPGHAVRYVLKEGGITAGPAGRGRLLRQAAAEVRADAVDLRRDLPALVRVLPQGDAGVAAREAVGALAHPQGAQDLQGAHLLRRAPHEPRGLGLPALAVRGGGHPHGGRRRRVGHRVVRRGQGQRHQALQGDPLPAQPGPALQRVHLLPGLQGQQRRVQGHGPGALRQAGALRPDHEGHDPPARGRVVQAEHEVLQLRLRPAHDQRRLRRLLRRPARASPRAG